MHESPLPTATFRVAAKMRCSRREAGSHGVDGDTGRGRQATGNIIASASLPSTCAIVGDAAHQRTAANADHRDSPAKRGLALMMTVSRHQEVRLHRVG